MGADGVDFVYTPTWVVAVVCTIIVAVSLAVERLIHHAGKYLKKKNQKSLFEALQKVKEELMLLGFISLLLTVAQNAVSNICVHRNVVSHMLPCELDEKGEAELNDESTSKHYERFLLAVISRGRQLKQESSMEALNYCAKKGKVPLLSLEAIHHLHIFIFVLAVVHVVFSALTIIFGGAKIRQWQHWEKSIANQHTETNQAMEEKFTHVHQHAFIREHFVGIGWHSTFLRWLHSFLKQFYASVTKSDYTTLRLGFIMTHCRANPRFNFHKYMLRALEDDFKHVVGISWYLWIFVVIFLLLNVNGWHTYFWIAFIPFLLLIAVGTKLEYIMTRLAHEVAEKHVAVIGDLVVQPSDKHFWFNRPGIVLILIHFILFQNAFEIAFFFWIWAQYGFDSCAMGHIRYIVPRLIIGVFVQVLCSYSTLPLYALVTQMGSSFKKAIFDENVQAGLVGWVKGVKRKKEAGVSNNPPHRHTNNGSSVGIQLGKLSRPASPPNEEIQLEIDPDASKQ